MQSINIAYSNVENMTVAHITKRMEIIMSPQVCPISQMSIDYKENGGTKSVAHITKRMEIITSPQVCPISRMSIDYKENSGTKSFSCKSKASISCIPMTRT